MNRRPLGYEPSELPNCSTPQGLTLAHTRRPASRCQGARCLQGTRAAAAAAARKPFPEESSGSVCARLIAAISPSFRRIASSCALTTLARSNVTPARVDEWHVVWHKGPGQGDITIIYVADIPAGQAFSPGAPEAGSRIHSGQRMVVRDTVYPVTDVQCGAAPLTATRPFAPPVMTVFTKAVGVAALAPVVCGCRTSGGPVSLIQQVRCPVERLQPCVKLATLLGEPTDLSSQTADIQVGH